MHPWFEQFVSLRLFLGFSNGADSNGAIYQALSAIHRGCIADSNTLVAPGGFAPARGAAEGGALGGCRNRRRIHDVSPIRPDCQPCLGSLCY